MVIGQNYIVQATNASIAVFGKSGVMVTGYPKSLDAFVGISTGLLYDPRLIYDKLKGRYIMVIDQGRIGGPSSSQFYIAVSKTSNPLSG